MFNLKRLQRTIFAFLILKRTGSQERKNFSAALKQALTNLENNFAAGNFDHEVSSLASGKKLPANSK